LEIRLEISNKICPFVLLRPRKADQKIGPPKTAEKPAESTAKMLFYEKKNGNDAVFRWVIPLLQKYGNMVIFWYSAYHQIVTIKISKNRNYLKNFRV